MYCRTCSYDLGATETGRCPECGRGFDPRIPRTWMPAAAWPAARAVPATLAVAVLLLALAIFLPWTIRVLPLPWIFGIFWLYDQFGPAVTHLGTFLSLILYFALLTAGFVAWNCQLLNGWPTVPHRTTVLLAVLQLLNWWWVAHHLGDHAGSPAYLVRMCGLSAALSLAIAAGWLVARRSPRFALSLAWHATAWLWLMLFAFPYWGPLP